MMTAFFICIIIIGILMVTVSMIWIIIEKKRTADYRLSVEEQKYDLEHVIKDAEQLLDELNNFSGYIVSQMEEKQQEIKSAIKSADEILNKAKDIKARLQPEVDMCYSHNAAGYKLVYIDNQNTEKELMSPEPDLEYLKSVVQDVSSDEKASYSNGCYNHDVQDKPPVPVMKAKVIPFHEKKREVIKLYKDGMDCTEIAKLLEMGKGEIELISKMC